MKGSKPVCLLCRHRIAAARIARPTQWQTQSQTQTQQACRFSTTGSRYDDTAPASAAEHAQQANDPIRRVASTRRQHSSSVKLPRDTPKKRPAKHPARVDALFQQIVQGQRSTGDSASGRTESVGKRIDLSLVQAIKRLQDMVHNQVPVADAYMYLQSELYPSIRQADVHVPQIYYKVVSSLMDKVFEAKKETFHQSDLPTVAEIFRVYADIGERKPKHWTVLVGQLVQEILKISPSVHDHPSADVYEQQSAVREAMLTDLVECWKVLSLPKIALPSSQDNEITDGFWFPRLDKFHLLKFSQSGNFIAAFAKIFPHYPPISLEAPVAVLAIATYALLLDEKRASIRVQRAATRFLSKVAYLITYVHFRDEALRRHVANHFPDLVTYIMGRWPILKADLRDRVESSTRASEPSTQNIGDVSWTTGTKVINAASLGYRLSQAHGTANQSQVERLWREFLGPDKVISTERAAELRKHPDLINSFINTRMALNQPDQAIMTWNTMRKVGLQPTLKTWNLMLDGCKRARNVNGIQNIWKRLVASGVQPDTALWTTRISGLVESGAIEQGLGALREMSRLWKTRANDPNSTAIQPTIQPVNAALAGLIRQNQQGLAGQLLAWAGQEGLEPDTYTFNTLLRPLVRNRLDREVQQLFATMEQKGVRADEATFTIVLDAAFSDLASPDPQEQGRLVSQVINEMEAVGLETNMQNYAKMIHLLLRNNNKSAVMAVLSHLWDKNREMSPHIYTLVAEHFLSREPPDLAAVEDLLQLRRVLDYDDMDRVFYERVVRGYVRAGATRKARDIYKRFDEAGVNMVLGTLVELLQALVDRRQDAEAAELVNSTYARAIEQKPRTPENRMFWEHRFWHLAVSKGLVDPEYTDIHTDRQTDR
ncbi:hypothetical protein F4778DRAFT_769392 [Xylariomycetidae sp. FL2044]|nr:hypothetical protein F4778DRAFT_769392 [Xylariomycetidae sp. FL2044]